MTLNMNDGSDLGLLRGLRAAALAGVAALLVACGGDSDCTSPPAFEGEQVGECDGDGRARRASGCRPDAGAQRREPVQQRHAARSRPPRRRSMRIATRWPAIPVSVQREQQRAGHGQRHRHRRQGRRHAQRSASAPTAPTASVTVTATSGSLSRTATFQVVGRQPDGDAVAGRHRAWCDRRKVDFRLVDVNSNPMSGQTIVVNGVNGGRSQRHDRQQRQLQLRLHRAGSGGSLRHPRHGRRRVDDADGAGAVRHRHDSSRPSIAVQSASLAASPSVVPVNTGSTSNRSELRALFLGAGNAPVQNVRVRFDLAGDVNSIGGSLTSGTQRRLQRRQRRGHHRLRAGQPLQPDRWPDGARLLVGQRLPEPGTCPNAATATLTVISEALVGVDQHRTR